MDSLFLGLDCSTQSLSAIVIDFAEKKVIFEASLNFDKTFPHYKTHKGALRDRDPLVVHSSPLMWLEALDKMFELMKSEGVALHHIVAISGSAQQHGSVYLNSAFDFDVSHLDLTKGLHENLKKTLSRETAPIWMDSSTSEQCSQIEKALGGKTKVIQVTGSAPFERFTGPQIRKFYQQEPEKYESTKHICLVSSFMASILAGKIAPIDHTDGSGMNLMNIERKDWDSLALEATAPNLIEKLPPLAKSWEIIGKVNPYFVKKYGVNSEALCLPWMGDNPSSILGLGLIEKGMVAISLGTSFTYFGYLETPQVDLKGEGHLFVAPTGDYMTLNCFINGALAIEKLRNIYGINWDEFDLALVETNPGNDGAIFMPYFEAEIVPKVLKPGIHRFDLDEKDMKANCRALIEAQMLSMKIHSDWMKIKPSKIYVTGGVSHHEPILQILADIHQCEVLSSDIQKSTALGATFLAVYGYYLFHKKPLTWKDITQDFAQKGLHQQIMPNHQQDRVYEKLALKYKECEKRIRF